MKHKSAGGDLSEQLKSSVQEFSQDKTALQDTAITRSMNVAFRWVYE